MFNKLKIQYNFKKHIGVFRMEINSLFSVKGKTETFAQKNQRNKRTGPVWNLTGTNSLQIESKGALLDNQNKQYE